MAGNSNKIYIAIVEDDDGLARALARLLRASGYHPVSYGSAEEFLGDTNNPAFACLVVDIQLDGMSGLELSDRLAASGSVTPLIFLTASEDRRCLEQRKHRSLAGLLGKSDPGEVVLAAIDRAIQGAHQTGQAIS